MKWKLAGILLALFIIVLIIAGWFQRRREEGNYRLISYVVQRGDTLYALACTYAEEDWRKWAAEVKKQNCMEGSGLTEGDSIRIPVTNKWADETIR